VQVEINLRAHYLSPKFAEKPLNRIGPEDLTMFFREAGKGRRKKYLLNRVQLIDQFLGP
jgi:hypothetical protein